jgi:hypothetical protein
MSVDVKHREFYHEETGFGFGCCGGLFYGGWVRYLDYPGGGYYAADGE